MPALASLSAAVRRLVPDSFTVLLLCSVAVASLLPCEGQAARVFGDVTTFAIGLLFFLHGAKLSREAVIAGVTHAGFACGSTCHSRQPDRTTRPTRSRASVGDACMAISPTGGRAGQSRQHEREYHGLPPAGG